VTFGFWANLEINFDGVHAYIAKQTKQKKKKVVSPPFGLVAP
jgi:hypothetical protein